MSDTSICEYIISMGMTSSLSVYIAFRAGRRVRSLTPENMEEKLTDFCFDSLKELILFPGFTCSQFVFNYFFYFVIFLFLIRTSFLLFQYILPYLFYPQGILPSELSLLDFYLDQPGQDPEWVAYVWDHLWSQDTSTRAYEIMFRDFLNTEICFETRNKIISFYQLIFYGREDPSFFIAPTDLNLILRVHLEGVEFNQSALHQVLTSLCTDGHKSSFYLAIQEEQATHFKGFIALKNQKQQMDIELLNEYKNLKRRNAFLIEENASLKEKLLILDREMGKAF